MRLVKFLSIIVLMMFVTPALLKADITATDVSVSLGVSYFDYETESFISDIEGSSFGTTAASLNLAGPITGMSIGADLELSNINPGSAVLDFDLDMHGNNYTGDFGHMGPVYSGVVADIFYSSATPFLVNVDYDFGYTGAWPFGMSYVRIFIDSYMDMLGNYGEIGYYSGTFSHALPAGNYIIQTQFMPNVTGPIGDIDGYLAGSIDYSFASVPEPGSCLLLGTGIGAIGLAALRKKRWF